MNNEKRKKWGLLAKKFSSTGDKLGKGIDKKILETVMALNALGINTDQSCEGHLKWGNVFTMGRYKSHQHRKT